jgi:hypothetical protein
MKRREFITSIGGLAPPILTSGGKAAGKRLTPNGRFRRLSPRDWRMAAIFSFDAEAVPGSRKLLRLKQGRTSTAKSLAVSFDLKGLAMKYSKRSFAVVSVLFAVLLSLSTGTLNARDADLASRTFAAAQTARQQCMNACRARYHACFSLKQIPSFECRGIYRDCVRFTCDAMKG